MSFSDCWVRCERFARQAVRRAVRQAVRVAWVVVGGWPIQALFWLEWGAGVIIHPCQSGFGGSTMELNGNGR